MTGKLSYLAGFHAEEQVAQAYRNSGRPVVARRWRGSHGEIDVIAREGDRVVFIEVKKSRTHEMAAQHLTEGQMLRIWHTAEEFLGGEPAGLNTEARIDVALVDQMGRIEILENAYAA
jgi:putative endonuclease